MALPTATPDPADALLSKEELEAKYMAFTDCAALGHPLYNRGMFNAGRGPVPSNGPYWAWVHACVQHDKPRGLKAK